jgi:hypothetical protein
MVLMTLMLSLGLASFAFVDTEQREAARERVRESAFNLTEGVLNTQTFVVARSWPEQAPGAPRFCTGASAAEVRCPDPARIAQTYAGGDYSGGSTWVVSARDNGGDLASTPLKVERDSMVFYDASDDDDLDTTDSDDDLADLTDDGDDIATDAQPTWDANDDGLMWVRAQATVQGRRRTLVAQVKVQEIQESFPRHTITAGKFSTPNRGNKEIVNLKGSSAQAGPLAVRCTVRGPGCLDYEQGKGQVSPDDASTVVLGFQDGGSALTADALQRLKERAIANGSYSAGCPANPSGDIVYVQQGNCSYNSSVPGPCCNTLERPGVFIVENGTLTLGGNLQFYGVLYLANAQGSSGPVMTTTGTSLVHGSIAIDGQGELSAGSSGLNVEYDERVFGLLKSYPAGGAVAGSFREIEAG